MTKIFLIKIDKKPHDVEISIIFKNFNKKTLQNHQLSISLIFNKKTQFDFFSIVYLIKLVKVKRFFFKSLGINFIILTFYANHIDIFSSLTHLNSFLIRTRNSFIILIFTEFFIFYPNILLFLINILSLIDNGAYADILFYFAIYHSNLSFNSYSCTVFIIQER